MYPRLRLARELLSEDGVIFIKIKTFIYETNAKELLDKYFPEKEKIL
jgi:adenine specific DNA methylase Mod